VLDPLPLPDHDHPLAANLVAVSVPSCGVRILGVRVPAYGRDQRVRLNKSWDWLEEVAATLAGVPAVILGDLNVDLASRSGGAYLRRLLNAGWTRAAPEAGHTYYGHNGARSEIDHMLFSGQCTVARTFERSRSFAISVLIRSSSASSPISAIRSIESSACIFDFGIESMISRLNDLGQ
jgi:hypothetical protein